MFSPVLGHTWVKQLILVHVPPQHVWVIFLILGHQSTAFVGPNHPCLLGTNFSKDFDQPLQSPGQKINKSSQKWPFSGIFPHENPTWVTQFSFSAHRL